MDRKHHRQMHEATSRALSQLSFVLLGLLPLAATVGYCALLRLPTFQQQQLMHWEEQIAEATDLSVSIGDVQALTPKRHHLVDIVFSDKETGDRLASLPSVYVENQGGQWQISAASMVVEWLELTQNWNRIHDDVLCEALRPGKAVAFHVERLTINERGKQYAWSELQALATPGKEDSQLQIEFFQIADRTVDRLPAVLNCRREHTAGEQVSRFKLSSGSTPLPLSLVRPFWSHVDRLGMNAVFSGAVAWENNALGWNVTAKGQPSLASSNQNAKSTPAVVVYNVDLSQLLQPYSRELAGVGWLAIEEFAIKNNEVEFFEGEIRTGVGRLSRRILDGLQQHLGVEIASSVDPHGMHDLSFEQAGMAFRIKPATIEVIGTLDHGGLMVDTQGTLAGRVDARPIPLANLIQLLDAIDEVGLHTDELPSGPLSKSALQWLPVGGGVDSGIWSGSQSILR